MRQRADLHSLPTESTTLRVQVHDLLYKGAQDFAVVRALIVSDESEVTVIGDLGQCAPGETIQVFGTWETHPVHGRQFRSRYYVPLIPTSSTGLVKYLGSGLIPGVGSSLAERLVSRFGSKTLDVITTESARLREVKGIGAARARLIGDVVRGRRAEADTFSFLHGLGIGPSAAKRIVRRYGTDTVQRLREDPYLLAEEVAGIGFRTADQIGRALGFAEDDPRRAAGAVLYLLGRAAEEGHACTPADTLPSLAESLGIPTDSLKLAIDSLASRGLIVLDYHAVYPSLLHEAEVFVARRLLELASRTVGESRASESRDGLDWSGLSGEQKRAVEVTTRAGLVVLTGGPGTGKTTTVRAIVRAHEALGRKIVLCAPTGRAAKRLSEATSKEAQTIHRLLEWNPAVGKFSRGDSMPLEADTVLVDEASMLDLLLASHLLAALAPSATFVLVGDVDQLPPVQPGQILRDLISSGVGQTVRLSQVFRQAQESAIVRGAHAILHGQLPEASAPGGREDGALYRVRIDDANAVGPRLVQVMNRIRMAFGIDPARDVQVLTPMRKGPAGADQLNLLLQAELNPADSRAGMSRFRVSDKVMQLRNDYEREVFNGDIGEVSRIEGGTTWVRVDGREVSYGPDELESLTLAYASTVHKAQGSEFPVVVVVVHSSHSVMLHRQLLYTAVTRGKRLVVLLGDTRGLRRAVHRVLARAKNSHLVDRLTAARQ